MRRKATVTIVLPVYNEEKNIENILEAISKQRHSTYLLKKILIHSDSSTDNTNSIIKRLQQKYPIIELKAHKQRKGKVHWMKTSYQANTSDILVTLDADIGLVGSNFLDTLIAPLLSDASAQLVVAHQIPLRPRNFMGKLIYSTFLLWDYIRLSVPNQQSVHNLYDAASAFRGSFAKTLRMPKGATDERLYLYLMAKEQNGFRYCTDAKIIYWSIASLREYVKLAERPSGTPQPSLNKLFGRDVSIEYLIPKKYKMIGIFKSFLHHPLYTPAAILFGYIFSRITMFKKIRTSIIWEISNSTKLPITDKEISLYAKLA